MSALQRDLMRLAPMHPAHLPAVLDIERRAYSHPWTEAIFADCLRVGYSSWVLSDTLGDVMGYALMSMAVGEAHILNLCVDPEMQGRGLGRFLLGHLLAVARAAQVELVLLEVRVSNAAAIRLYDTAGFREIGTRRGYYPLGKGREDALVLALDLNV